MVYNGTPYYYLKNLQGDIISITNAKGDVVARYSYDAWGKCTILQDTSVNGSIATVNPFRYRGYYFDRQTELYYLNSRYYDPELGRFINGDTTDILTLSNNPLLFNLFAYCLNDSINNLDPTGYAGFRDLWNAIKDSFELIKRIADQAYNACKNAVPIKQIKKLSKQSGKSQRQIIRELNKLAKDSERCYRNFKIAGIVVSVISVIIFAVSYLQYGKSLFADVYALIVDLFIEAASWIICKLADLACKAIPICGLIIGFAASWLIGQIIATFFTSAKKKKMTQAYKTKMKKSKKWYDWFLNLFKSVSAAF